MFSFCKYKIIEQATKCGGNDWFVTPSFPYLVNKVNNPLLPYSHLRIFCYINKFLVLCLLHKVQKSCLKTVIVNIPLSLLV